MTEESGFAYIHKYLKAFTKNNSKFNYGTVNHSPLFYILDATTDLDSFCNISFRH